MARRLASILVGDSLGQVKKILWPSGEISIIPDLAEPSSANPIVSIEPIGDRPNRHLICYKNGDLFIYDSIEGTTKPRNNKSGLPVVKALSINDKDMVLVSEKQISFIYSNKPSEVTIKLKKGQIKDAKVIGEMLAIVGKDIPLKVFDLKTRNKIYEAKPPEKDWLGITPGCEVEALDIVDSHRIATCSKSDSVIRVYDLKSNNPHPTISVLLDQTAFNEYAEAGRFYSIAASTGKGSANNKMIVAGSNVGQLIAIELRLNIKKQSKKKLQPRSYKILGGFKGSRGASFSDIQVVEADPEDEKSDYKVISCCLDRYLRIHNMSFKSGRYLDKQIYCKTKPTCCAPVFYE